MIVFNTSKTHRKVALARLSVLIAMGTLAVSPAWGQPTQAARSEKRPSDVVSLRVDSRQVIRGPRGTEAVYRLVNDSPKTIVAWEFGCVTAPQRGGRGLHGSIGFDSYSEYERGVQRQLSPPGEVIESGQIFEQRMTVTEKELDGPMAGKSCGPVSVIFADASYEGLETVASFWFRTRAQTAVDSRMAYQALERRLAGGELLVGALTALASELARPATGEKGISFGADTFSVFLDQAHRGQSISADQVLASLEFQFQAAMKHLPESWQEKVMSEVEP